MDRDIRSVVSAVGRPFVALLAGAIMCSAAHAAQPSETEGAPGGARLLEDGQPVAIIHSTVDDMERFRKAGGRGSGASGASRPDG